jgi:hypothetical protein
MTARRTPVALIGGPRCGESLHLPAGKNGGPSSFRLAIPTADGLRLHLYELVAPRPPWRFLHSAIRLTTASR